MKPPLLVLSLVANAALLAGVAYLALSPSARPTTEQPKESAAIALPKPGAPGQSQPRDSGTVPTPAPMPASWQSPNDVEAWLRSTGAPLKVRYAVAQAMLDRKYAAAYAAARHPPGSKRWQRSIRPSPEQREQMSAVSLERTQELQRLFGADYAKANYDENIEALTGLPAEKLVELNRVNTDYVETRMKLMQSGRNWSPAAQQLLDDEMKADMRKILTPEEFELHQAYESQDSQILQRSMAGLDVDDETYLRAYRAVAAVKARSQQPGNGRDVRLEEIQAIEQAVGPEIAAHITMNQDATYREVGALYSAHNLPAAAMLGKYQTWLQFYKATAGWGPNTPLTDSHLTMVRSYRDLLTEGLSAADRAKFDRTRTGALMGRLLEKK